MAASWQDDVNRHMSESKTEREAITARVEQLATGLSAAVELNRTYADKIATCETHIEDLAKRLEALFASAPPFTATDKKNLDEVAAIRGTINTIRRELNKASSSSGSDSGSGFDDAGGGEALGSVRLVEQTMRVVGSDGSASDTGDVQSARMRALSRVRSASVVQPAVGEGVAIKVASVMGELLTGLAEEHRASFYDSLVVGDEMSVLIGGAGQWTLNTAFVALRAANTERHKLVVLIKTNDEVAASVLLAFPLAAATKLIAPYSFSQMEELAPEEARKIAAELGPFPTSRAIGLEFSSSSPLGPHRHTLILVPWHAPSAFRWLVGLVAALKFRPSLAERPTVGRASVAGGSRSYTGGAVAARALAWGGSAFHEHAVRHTEVLGDMLGTGKVFGRPVVDFDAQLEPARHGVGYSLRVATHGIGVVDDLVYPELPQAGIEDALLMLAGSLRQRKRRLGAFVNSIHTHDAAVDDPPRLTLVSALRDEIVRAELEEAFIKMLAGTVESNVVRIADVLVSAPWLLHILYVSYAHEVDAGPSLFRRRSRAVWGGASSTTPATLCRGMALAAPNERNPSLHLRAAPWDVHASAVIPSALLLGAVHSDDAGTWALFVTSNGLAVCSHNKAVAIELKLANDGARALTSHSVLAFAPALELGGVFVVSLVKSRSNGDVRRKRVLRLEFLVLQVPQVQKNGSLMPVNIAQRVETGTGFAVHAIVNELKGPSLSLPRGLAPPLVATFLAHRSLLMVSAGAELFAVTITAPPVRKEANIAGHGGNGVSGEWLLTLALSNSYSFGVLRAIGADEAHTPDAVLRSEARVAARVPGADDNSESQRERAYPHLGFAAPGWGVDPYDEAVLVAASPDACVGAAVGSAQLYVPSLDLVFVYGGHWIRSRRERVPVGSLWTLDVGSSEGQLGSWRLVLDHDDTSVVRPPPMAAPSLAFARHPSMPTASLLVLASGGVSPATYAAQPSVASDTTFGWQDTKARDVTAAWFRSQPWRLLWIYSPYLDLWWAARLELAPSLIESSNNVLDAPFAILGMDAGFVASSSSPLSELVPVVTLVVAAHETKDVLHLRVELPHQPPSHPATGALASLAGMDGGLATRAGISLTTHGMDAVLDSPLYAVDGLVAPVAASVLPASAAAAARDPLSLDVHGARPQLADLGFDLVFPSFPRDVQRLVNARDVGEPVFAALLDSWISGLASWESKSTRASNAVITALLHFVAEFGSEPLWAAFSSRTRAVSFSSALESVLEGALASPEAFEASNVTFDDIVRLVVVLDSLSARLEFHGLFAVAGQVLHRLLHLRNVLDGNVLSNMARPTLAGASAYVAASVTPCVAASLHLSGINADFEWLDGHGSPLVLYSGQLTLEMRRFKRTSTKEVHAVVVMALAPPNPPSASWRLTAWFALLLASRSEPLFVAAIAPEGRTPPLVTEFAIARDGGCVTVTLEDEMGKTEELVLKGPRTALSLFERAFTMASETLAAREGTWAASSSPAEHLPSSLVHQLTLEAVLLPTIGAARPEFVVATVHASREAGDYLLARSHVDTLFKAACVKASAASAVLRFAYDVVLPLSGVPSLRANLFSSADHGARVQRARVEVVAKHLRPSGLDPRQEMFWTWVGWAGFTLFHVAERPHARVLLPVLVAVVGVINLYGDLDDAEKEDTLGALRAAQEGNAVAHGWPLACYTQLKKNERASLANKSFIDVDEEAYSFSDEDTETAVKSRSNGGEGGGPSRPQTPVALDEDEDELLSADAREAVLVRMFAALQSFGKPLLDAAWEYVVFVVSSTRAMARLGDLVCFWACLRFVRFVVEDTTLPAGLRDKHEALRGTFFGERGESGLWQFARSLPHVSLLERAFEASKYDALAEPEVCRVGGEIVERAAGEAWCLAEAMVTSLDLEPLVGRVTAHLSELLQTLRVLDAHNVHRLSLDKKAGALATARKVSKNSVTPDVCHAAVSAASSALNVIDFLVGQVLRDERSMGRLLSASNVETHAPKLTSRLETNVAVVKSLSGSESLLSSDVGKHLASGALAEEEARRHGADFGTRTWVDARSVEAQQMQRNATVGAGRGRADTVDAMLGVSVSSTVQASLSSDLVMGMGERHMIGSWLVAYTKVVAVMTDMLSNVSDHVVEYGCNVASVNYARVPAGKNGRRKAKAVRRTTEEALDRHTGLMASQMREDAERVLAPAKAFVATVSTCIESLNGCVDELVANPRFRDLPPVGAAKAKMIDSLLRSGLTLEHELESGTDSF
ncbi:uncharacterized protein AMSG_12191 [Thecamonas trahens ATCC 50062]|uniref:Uncharacterized protein n=1 Tax=Thecamonas trahens ATCC 50062 TaxID=461836 RepID=A0A0L0DL70_THETB|nr:hypothetical protein AMSG_12191 [Thecamonas trahens ATCC 50062]KNC52781.1 hypothetical protein AMSG_12191 [Thecamonas trahens ATCC 50062]|eukprot:XP_013755133.1 hypothetical protein AMSG_12191 [Thecamonas trahens ATCC 50062]